MTALFMEFGHIQSVFVFKPVPMPISRLKRDQGFENVLVLHFHFILGFEVNIGIKIKRNHMS